MNNSSARSLKIDFISSCKTFKLRKDIVTALDLLYYTSLGYFLLTEVRWTNICKVLDCCDEASSARIHREHSFQKAAPEGDCKTANEEHVLQMFSPSVWKEIRTGKWILECMERYFNS